MILKTTAAITATLTLSIFCSTQVSASEEVMNPGAKVYQSACMVCHVAEGRPTIAPPIFAVKGHVIAVHPERDDFIKRVVSWVKEPNADDALMPGAVRKFKVMPAMPHLSDEDLVAVAEYLYDTDMELPDWYKEHYEEEHGEAPKEATSKEEEVTEEAAAKE
uniref:Cytochrome c domain-containing protein n=1 Tax=uncultured Thiotrichaceae bacterium TaxID=298394 RepID=A0A6S6TW07_9GAMM|nr:MAG: Unknown protein [uncultured Thiotrichaceae bacterium]